MTDGIHQALDRLATVYRGGGTLALFLDYDGTLVPIVEHPRLAMLAPETRDVLRHLATLPRVIVGIVSGRSLDDLKTMVALSCLYYVGTCGLEYELRGTRWTHGDSLEVSELLAQVSDRLTGITQFYPGAWLEQKPIGLTLHYREVAADRQTELRAYTDSILAPFECNLRVIDGPMAREITPDLGWTKGTAVHWLCKEIGASVTPLYAGDHTNDADALVMAAELGGVSIGIGPDAPAATQHRVADPEALIGLLRGLSDSLTPDN